MARVGLPGGRRGGGGSRWRPSWHASHTSSGHSTDRAQPHEHSHCRSSSRIPLLRPAADERGRGSGRTDPRPRRARLLVRPPAATRGLAHLPRRSARRGLPRRAADGRRPCPAAASCRLATRISRSGSSMPASWRSPSAWPSRRWRRSTSVIFERCDPPMWSHLSSGRERPQHGRWWHAGGGDGARGSGVAAGSPGARWVARPLRGEPPTGGGRVDHVGRVPTLGRVVARDGGWLRTPGRHSRRPWRRRRCRRCCPSPPPRAGRSS